MPRRLAMEPVVRGSGRPVTPVSAARGRVVCGPWSRCVRPVAPGRPATGSVPSSGRQGGPINRSAQWPVPTPANAAGSSKSWRCRSTGDRAEPLDAHPSVDRAWVPWIPRCWSSPAAAKGRPTGRFAAGSSAQPAWSWLRRRRVTSRRQPGRRRATGYPSSHPDRPTGLRWMVRTLRYHACGPVAQRQSRRLLISRSWVQVPPGSPSPGL